MTNWLPTQPDQGRSVISGRCSIDGRPGYEYCTDTGLTICYDCMVRPGIIGGRDHKLPGTEVLCAHQDPQRPAFDSGTAESIRYRPNDDDSIPSLGILHWPAGRCWCDEFHRDQAVTLEFDPWRRAMSTYAPRPQLLG